MGIIFTSEKRVNTNAKTLGVVQRNRFKYESNYGWFHFTFLKYDFHDHKTGKVKSKSDIYWSNPKAAIAMATSLMIPKRYTLVAYSSNKNLRYAS